MKIITQALLIILLYALGFSLLGWFFFIFLFQYIALLGQGADVFSSFLNPEILTAGWLSISSSCVTVVISVIFGIPLAYIFATRSFKGKSFLETLIIDVPQTFPPVAEGIILLLMLGPQSPFHLNIAYTYAALVLTKLFVSAPFIIAFAVRKFRDIQETGLDIIARTLGANEIQLFFTIFLPLAAKDILSATSLCWARAMGELGGGLIFAGAIPYKTEDISIYIATHSKQTAPALAATILVTTASLLALLLFKRFTKGTKAWKGLF